MRLICPGSIAFFNLLPVIPPNKKLSLILDKLIQSFTADVVSISSTNKTPSLVWSVFDWRSRIKPCPSPHCVKSYTLSEVSSERLRNAVYARSRGILFLMPRKIVVNPPRRKNCEGGYAGDRDPNLGFQPKELSVSLEPHEERQ